MNVFSCDKKTVFTFLNQYGKDFYNVYISDTQPSMRTRQANDIMKYKNQLQYILTIPVL